MNRGPRGGAHGFQLQSLLKIADTKASRQKEYTLLHYIVHVIDDTVLVLENVYKEELKENVELIDSRKREKGTTKRWKSEINEAMCSEHFLLLS